MYVVIFKNEFLEVSEKNGKIFVETLQTGFLLKDFDAIIRQNPRIKLTNFAVLKNVLGNVSKTPTEIGKWLSALSVEVSRDKMSASLFINEKLDEIRENKEKFQQDVKQLLAEHNIKHGILDIKLEKIVSGKAILIAQGTPPMKGDDAIVTYLQIPERKPVIREDGKADYYDMNFIYEIEEGAWLGEKLHAQPGSPGYNVYGEVVPAQNGRDAALKFDRKSAYEVEEEDKTVIRSKISGVLEDSKGIVGVNHHLPISGDVGIETGNIEFNGSLSIRGTVQAGFSVIAQGDISIEGAEGVSGAKLIKSIEGDIFIRGGIFGLGKTRIEAGGSIFVKHVNEANLKAGQDVNIGFYALGSNIKGHSILVDERKGKIIGGIAIAKSIIKTAISGNRLERRTELIINSINKQDGLEIIQSKAAFLKSLQEDVLKLEEQVNRVLPFVSNLTRPQLAAFEQTKQKLLASKEEATELDREIKQLMNDLRNVGQEEIHVTKEAYPGTYVQIGKKSSMLSNATNGKFLLEFGELNV
ncbi:MAG: FapA family protein [Solibacillus sp.]